MPLIGSDQTLALSALVMAIVAFGMWAERTRWGARLGGPVLLLAVPMVLANLNVMPHSAALYDGVAVYVVPAAIPLLLLRADLRSILRESGTMLLAFALAAGATTVGALVSVHLVDLGAKEAEIAGTILSSYIGGSLNFVASAEALGIRDSSVYVASLAADAVGAVFFLVALMLLPAMSFVRKSMPSKFLDGSVDESTGDATHQATAFHLPHAANGLAISLAICAASHALCAWLNLESLYILVVTAIALVVANFARPVLRHVSADFEIGTLFMYLFFVCIGAGADFVEVAGAALPILAYIIIMVIVHLLLLIGIGRMLRLDLAEVMIASNACILGPGTAAALAASKGWKTLVAPGILVGMLGYAIGTFIGVSVAALLKFWAA
ncbi:MAG: DUF819 family protein [Steroidobacteraceae bacterium]